MKREDGQSDGQRAGTQRMLEGANGEERRRREKELFSFSGLSSFRALARERARDHFLFLSFSKFVGRLGIVRAHGDSRETGASPSGAPGRRPVARRGQIH